MDYCLSQLLPAELVHKIAKEVHRLNMRDVHDQLKNCVTWIYVKYEGEEKLSFIVSNNYNYYRVLYVGNSISTEPWFSVD